MPHPDADALATAPTDVVDPANPAPADARTFAELQSALDAAKERCRALRKQLRPIRRRLDKRMTSLDLAELQCPPYVLRVEQPSGNEDEDDGAEAEDDGDGDGDEGERGAVFTKRRVSDFLTAAQYAAYCSNNPRPKRRRRIVCERRDDVPTAATVAAGSDMSTGSDGSDGGSASE